MLLLVHLGRFVMLGWAVYGLLLIFTPALIRQAPNQAAGIVQFVLAYGIGYGLDRLLGRLQRRKAAAGLAVEPAPGDPGGV